MAKSKSELSITQPTNLAFAETEENVKLLKETLTAAGTNLSDNELSLFLHQAKQTGLDPLARQIYVMKSGSKISFMTSIDGQRLVAQRTGDYEGQVGPQWCGEDGQWVDVWLKKEDPSASRVGVYRKGFQAPVYGIATWKSYANTNSPTWKKMGDVMLAKCAEALAIRKAFPQELSGLYTAEEMDQAQPEAATVIDNDTGEIKPTVKYVSAPQLGKMFASLKAKGVKEKRDAEDIIHALGTVESAKDMTTQQASAVIEEIEASDLEYLMALRPNAVDDVVEGEVVVEG